MDLLPACEVDDDVSANDETMSLNEENVANDEDNEFNVSGPIFTPKPSLNGILSSESDDESMQQQ